MKTDSRYLIAAAVVILLVLLNMWQYGFFDEDNATTTRRPVAVTQPKNAEDLQAVLDTLASYQSKDMQSDLFARTLPDAVDDAAEAVVSPEPVAPVISAPVEPVLNVDDITVLAVSEHANGVAALVRYQNKTFTVKVNDVIDDTYRVKAIRGKTLVLSKESP